MTILTKSDKNKLTTPSDSAVIEQDAEFMRLALDLASRGVGQVSPSPLVGCVIVSTEGEVVGQGYYRYEHLKHAEMIALDQAGHRAHGGTAYVSLEPHAHFGRTPPCTDALIRAGIKRVVAPIEDPNPDVAGKGFAHLSAAGIEVVTGILSEEATRLNEKYIHSLKHARPFVHLKVACSLDGKLATKTGDSKWITSDFTRAQAQLLRHENDAILVGAGTAASDDPLLTDRSGLKRHRPLIRVVLDGALSLRTDSRLVQTAHEYPLMVFGNSLANPGKADELRSLGVEVVHTDNGTRDIRNVLEILHRRTVRGLLVEGGARIAGAFVDAGLVDKFSFFIAPKVIGGEDAPGAVGGSGIARMSEAVTLRDIEVKMHGNDIEVTGYPSTGR
jgi:diaminohydroxyphosphoribosylaminopyrimidine deaminase/5-amino-6-(5-phosphoribosylamino)uracil reductase